MFAIEGLLHLPLDLYATFGIEARFGFNRMTWRLWLSDAVKGVLLAVVIGGPLVALVLWIMAASGPLWWLWAWVRLGGLQPDRAGAGADRDRAALQPLRAARRTRRSKRGCGP